MKPLSGAREIALALQAVGELLEAEGESYAIVVIGGAALNLLGIVERTTRDVDIIAFAESGVLKPSALLLPPVPLPAPLVKAIAIVADDFELAEDWLNTAPALQLDAGLPNGLLARIEWRQFAGLRVGLVAPRDLVAFKLFAAADEWPGVRHASDLIALRPSETELADAAKWVKGQDANVLEFPRIVDQVIAHVRNQRDAAHG